ncbi:MAG: putative Clathrin heavy chain, partial [Streblomastix strix]
VRLCTDIANSWAGKVLDRREIIHIFEENKLVEAVYLHLQSIASTLEENDIVFSFIRAAVQMQQLKEVEIVVRDSTHYDAVEVRDFLMEKNLPDSKALMILCDKHNFVNELVRYLWNGRQTNAIEQYVSGLSPRSLPAVVGALLDFDAEESFISSVLHLVKSGFDISALVEATENRGRLALLRNFLEARVSEDNSTDPALHTALAKIYVDSNPQGAAEFITANEYYDARIVGHYCERRNGDLALLCYRKRQCDDELLALTTRDELFREQAQYIMSRKDKDLWARVLKEDNAARAKLIVQVKFDAIRTCQDVGEVSAVVKAFAFAELTSDLIELLDTILFTNQVFAENQFLQNLLLVTAIKEKSSELRRYIHRLNNYKAADIAQTALANGLTEEAFEIYQKANMHKDAVSTLLDKIDNIDRAVAYAKLVNISECYKLVARGQMSRDLIADMIESYLRADDPQDFELVIEKTKNAELFAPLVKFLLMARQKLKEEVVDSALVYSYARLNQLAELEESINMPSKAKLDQVGEQCFQEGLLQAARSIFSHVGNYRRLASTCIRLRQYQEAVEAAKTAQKNSTGVETWREVCFACVDAQQFRLAQQCGVNVVMREEELPGLVKYYVQRGYFDEVIALMEQAMRRENSHKGIYTELGSLYSNFREEKLLEHIKLFHKHIILPQLMLVCRSNEQWSAVCLLQEHKGDHQDAAYTMIDHADAWKHSAFKEAMSRVSSKGAVNRAIDFYMQQHPRLLSELLTSIGENVDNGDLIFRLKNRGLLWLARSYLLNVQETAKQEIKEVNEAVVELLLEEESVDELRRIIELYPTFNQLGLAAKLEEHPLLALRRLGSWVYTLNKRFQSAVAIAKKDRMYEDAMLSAAMSGESALAEELLRYFAFDKEVNPAQRPNCFAACTYRCYDILQPDVVMELAWRAHLEDFAMPYKIQSTREYTTKVDDISREIAKINAELEQNKKISAAEKNLAPGPSSVPIQSQSQINLQLSAQNIPPPPNQYVPMGIPGMMGVYMAPAPFKYL